MYEPQVNDYVTWPKENQHVEGWVYFKDQEYITIEVSVSVRPKSDENYVACRLHRNDRLLVLCYHNQWNELKYVTSRASIHETENVMALLGKGTGREGIQE